MLRLKHALAAVPLLLLTACATTRAPVRQPGDAVTLGLQEQRERSLADTDHWTLQGRLSVSDGKDSGSGSLTWRQDGERYEFTVRAPVTGRSFRLVGGPDGADLEGLEGGTRHGADAESLMAQAVGWQIPMAELKRWVLGLRADAGPADIAFGADRLPSRLVQDGWTVDYKQWDAMRQPAMPSRVFAEKAPFKVRLSIEDWQLGR
ncbi:lipoprotein insertase outer membrane protein LolB [Luteibacter aegosomatis]|uniref:lipoprotein insertase outer membrane protein LolB n=1 Tax=Luteibacter aegosomatis TaxID=2911537 RepID=UPI001FF889CB|nr:lipoprotein insertase outer membrane protein LolB [Luteibacter aegosomatis]UPG84989.1 lipoprotein insertase outer membrane protein LolB [Luteibacter aegosomatis]